MRHERRAFLKKMAERVASRLMADLKAGKIATINIDAIRRELKREPLCPLNPRDFDALEEMTTQRVVENVG